MATSADLQATLDRLSADQPPLSVEANLGVTVDGTSLAVSTPDDRVHVQIPSIGAALSVFRSQGNRLGETAAVLDRVGLTAEFRIGDAVVAVAGAAADAGPIAGRVFGPHVELRPTEVVVAAIRLK